jgi:hypothetical protein
MSVFPLAGGSPRPVPGLESDFVPLRWSADNSSVFGYLPGHVPTNVYKVDLASGKKTLALQLQPATTTGVVYIAPVVITRDASRSAYSYYQVLSVLYLISGLK